MKILVIDYHNFCLEYNILSSHLMAFFSMNNIEYDYKRFDTSHVLDIDLEDKEYNRVFLNGCIATNRNVEFIERIITSIKSKNKLAEIFIYGCAGSFNLDKYEVTKIQLNKEDILSEYFPDISVAFKDINSIFINKFFDIYAERFPGAQKKRFYISVARWCIHNCSFCNTKKSIGYVKSRPISDIVSEIASYISNHPVDEVVLVSDDIGSYGKDIWVSYVELIHEIISISDGFKINLDYLEPSVFIGSLEKFMKILPRISYICIPIQSFNDRIIKLMNRNYSVSQFLNLITSIRENNPEILLMTQVIYGYPTETHEEFLENTKYIDFFDKIDFYPFSNIRNIHSGSTISKQELLKRRFYLKKILQERNNIKIF